MAAHLPIDPTRWGTTTALAEASPDLDLDGTQKRTSDNQLRWSVPIAVIPPEGSRPEAITLIVAAPVCPSVTPLTPIRLVDPVAITWSIGNRSGVSYRATAIQQLRVPGATE